MPTQKQIISMFNNIAPKYDKANIFISFNVESLWRTRSCNIALNYLKNKDLNLNIIDLACGTGAMIGSWERAFNANRINDFSIKGIDPSSKMLDIAKEKYSNIDFILSDGEDLKAENKSTDIISIVYGARNIVKLDESLSEIHRVLKDDGLFVVLEFFGDNNTSFISYFKNLYIRHIMPLIGGAITKNKDSFKYLSDSITNFDDTKTFQERLRKKGFEVVYMAGFSFNVSHCMVIKKIKNFKTTTTKTKTKTTKTTKTKDKISLPFDRALKTVSMKCFIKYYDDLINTNLNTKDLIEKMLKNEKYTKNSCQSRISNAKFIIKNGYIKEALEYIINAGRVDESTKRKSKKILKSL